ncbi:MAG TPA: GTPase ObgE [Candidatus Nitrosopolaris sp.]|nr:GTPase ObgE [Candidatus Nitrosopolaris sp.]
MWARTGGASASSRSSSFVDSARVVLRAGHGGRGSSSFRHEPFVPRGGPDGGDGGRGGSLSLKATNQLTDLSIYKRRPRWQAEPGADGAGGRKTGRNGADLVLEVPVGTLVLDSDGGLIADLAHQDATALVARGGLGGRGNVHFKSSTRHAPDYAEPGLKGDELTVTLDLKLIADVGLVGAPNAGKSSLLGALTAAHPKVADYPFTTLDPALGVAESAGGRFVIAEIPGLVEGASRGAGLGHRFLRHAERTRVLVYVVDGSAADPWQDLAAVSAEVERFSPELARRPHIVAVNKLDLDAAKALRRRSRRKDVLFLSARTGEGLPKLLDAMVAAIASAPEPATPARPATVRLPVAVAGMVVERTAWGFALRGDRVERLVERTDLESEGSLERFQVELDRLGVGAALESAGVQPGDTVRVADTEFEYQP